MPLLFILRILLLTLLSALTCAGSYAEQITITTDDDFIRVAPAQVNYLFGYTDMTPEQILASADSLPWHTATRPVLDPALSHSPVWIRLDLYNPQPRSINRILEIQWVNIDNITLYQPVWYAGLIMSRNGLEYIGDDDTESAPNFIFPLKLAAGTETSILLQISSKHLLMLPFYIWQEDRYERYELFYYSLYGMLFGAILVMFFYNLSLWIFIRDNNYILYCIYLVATILYILAATGAGKHIIWHDIPWLRIKAYTLFSSFVFFTAGVFIIYFLRLWERQRWMLYSSLLASAFWLIEIFLNIFFTRLPTDIVNIVALASSLLTFTITTKLALSGDRIAITFGIAWGFLIISTIILTLMYLGIVQHNFALQHIQSIGFMLETILISIALAQRFNIERDMREKTQKQLLKLQTQTNKVLEQRVKERTEELEALTMQLASSNSELHQLSVTDSLTGLNNRRSFDDFLRKEITRSRLNKRPFSLILADVDHFKNFNDTWGHVTGDECLRRVAGILKHNIRAQSDCAARYGGEEFVLILSGMDGEKASEKAETIRRMVSEMYFEQHMQSLYVTVSLGVVSVVIEDERLLPEQITAMADKALYQAKEGGRDQVQVYRDE